MSQLPVSTESSATKAATPTRTSWLTLRHSMEKVMGEFPSHQRKVPLVHTQSVTVLPGTNILRVNLILGIDDHNRELSIHNIEGDVSIAHDPHEIIASEPSWPQYIDRLPAVMLIPPRPHSSSHHSTPPPIHSDQTTENFAPADMSPPYSGQYPTVLTLHQTTQPTSLGKAEIVGDNGDTNQHIALELTQRGFITLAVDYPGFGEYTNVDPYALNYKSVTMKALFNHVVALDFLSGHPLVDPTRLAVCGHSLGGTNALFLAAFDDRIRACAVSCAFTSFAAYASHSRNSNNNNNLSGWSRRDKYMPLIAETYANDPKQMPFDFDQILSELYPKPLFISAPTADDVFDCNGVKQCVQTARKAYEAKVQENSQSSSVSSASSKRTGAIIREMDEADNIVAVYPNCKHELPNDIRQRMYAFLSKYLSVNK